METLIKTPNDKEGLSVVNSSLQSIILPLEVFTELMEYTNHYETEVSGCGLVEKVETRSIVGEYKKELVHTVSYRVKEVFLPPRQDNSWASTEIDEEMLGELVTGLIKNGKDPSKLRLHWHSHVNMTTFHSATDVENYGTLDNSEWLVSLVTNKRREVLGRVDIYNPVIVAFINVPVFVEVPTPTGLSDKIEVNLKALDEFVKSKEKKGYSYNCNQIGYNSKSHYSYVGVGVKDQQRMYKIKRKLRDQMKITDTQALRYEFCCKGELECASCKDGIECSTYITELEERIDGK